MNILVYSYTIICANIVNPKLQSQIADFYNNYDQTQIITDSNVSISNSELDMLYLETYMTDIEMDMTELETYMSDTEVDMTELEVYLPKIELPNDNKCPNTNSNNFTKDQITTENIQTLKVKLPEVYKDLTSFNAQEYYFELLKIQLLINKLIKNVKIYDTIHDSYKKNIIKLLSLRHRIRPKDLVEYRSNFSSDFIALFKTKCFYRKFGSKSEENKNIKLYNANLINELQEFTTSIDYDCDIETIFKTTYDFLLKELILMMQSEFEEVIKNLTDETEPCKLTSTKHAVSIYAYIYLYKELLFTSLMDIDPTSFDKKIKLTFMNSEKMHCKFCKQRLSTFIFIQNDTIRCLNYCNIHKQVFNTDILYHNIKNLNEIPNCFSRELLNQKILYLNRIDNSQKNKEKYQAIIYYKKMADIIRYLINNYWERTHIIRRIVKTISFLKNSNFNLYTLIPEILKFELQSKNRFAEITDDFSIDYLISVNHNNYLRNSDHLVDTDLKTKEELCICIHRVNSMPKADKKNKN